ncbi:hypothetical protein [Cuspidothrix issatschenkoi]|uniref:Uncharacterized protein n=1 Tax=Cuspidothrix issatschenkoi CHARLIE-1 TaxID=2052836 RepID=A0A2S6CZS9_9CYAN|nr:hypothetical protein [Cuspidothrix issatschenkoi]PPJ65264.1 hypothetical protein CUN59_00415 [Cuspidothrix issatschenkoi CHARLIE-1]
MSNITIKEIAKQLNIDEDIIRFSLAERYPNDYDSIREIPLVEYEIIAESLKLAAVSGVKQLSGNRQESEAIIQSNSELPTEVKQQIYSGVVNSLTDFYGSYHLSISEISNALAYVSSQKVVNDFVTIHSESVRHGLENYLDDFASQASEAAQLIMGVDAKDFLASNGINPQGEKKSVATQKAKSTASAIFSLLKK